MDRELNRLELQIKDYILDKSECSIESFRFEEIDPLKYLSKDEQLNKLNFIINKFYDALNRGYPFVAYNFKNNVFNEDNFFNTIPSVIIATEEKINIENFESNKVIEESITEFVRAKYLEMALRERDLILNSKTKKLELLNSTKTEFGIINEIHTKNTYHQIATPQNNIDVFLYNDLNIEIFEYLEGIKYERRPKTLDYFNLLFSEYNFFVENINNYLKIKEHFVIPELKDDESLYLKSLLYFKLVELIKQSFPIDNRKNIIKKTCEYIEKINQLLMDFNFQPLHFSDEFKLLREDFGKLDYKSQLI